MLTLTQLEEAIILGSLLGDGHIEKRGNSYRFKIRHCKAQKDYIFWKYKQLKRIIKNKPKAIKNNVVYDAFYFNTKSGLFLKKYHDLFYKSITSTQIDSNRETYKKTIK